MLMNVLRCFKGYTLSTVLDMPYAHFKRLNFLAEQVECMNTLTYMNAAAAPYDKDAVHRLLSVRDDNMFMSREVYKEVATEAAKEMANKFA
jgi:hypothetical protein